MSVLRRFPLMASGLLIVLSLAALAGVLARGQATVASVCSFAEIEDGNCGADRGAAG